MRCLRYWGIVEMASREASFITMNIHNVVGFNVCNVVRFHVRLIVKICNAVGFQDMLLVLDYM